AFDSATFSPEPFTAKTIVPWNLDPNDHATRISFFTMNVGSSFGDLASTITVDAEDVNHTHYSLRAEYVDSVPGYSWLGMLVIRLEENIPTGGDLLFSINAHGKTSNRVRAGIGSIGGGLPDDSQPAPAPTGISSA